jgi:hypothetical protein
MSRKFDIYQESWRIIRELETNGTATGPSICRDTVNHYYGLAHRKDDPTACIVTDDIYSLDAHYSIKHAVIENECWCLR